MEHHGNISHYVLICVGFDTFTSLFLLIFTLYHLPEARQCFLFVQVLAAFISANAGLSGRKINHPDTCFYLVHVLSALAAAAKGFKQHLFRVKNFSFGLRTTAKIQKPVLALVTNAVRTWTDPLHRTDKLR